MARRNEGHDYFFRSVGDHRTKVRSPSDHPYDCIARMLINYEDHEDYDSTNTHLGTGFLVENYVFVTAGHNILKSKKIAKSVTLQFESNETSYTTITLKGSDFTIRKGFRAGTETDIAWIDLSKHKDEVPKKMLSIDQSTDQFSDDIVNGEKNYTISGKYSRLNVSND